MDVICPQCAAKYDCNPKDLPAEGVAVKCADCNLLFRVSQSGAISVEPTADFTSDSPDTKLWSLRQASGSTWTFKRLTTLQKWIVERKVSKDDELSSGGQGWRKLSELGELAPFFEIVEQASRGAAGAAVRVLEPSSSPSPLSARPSAPPGAITISIAYPNADGSSPGQPVIIAEAKRPSQRLSPLPPPAALLSPQPSQRVAPVPAPKPSRAPLWVSLLLLAGAAGWYFGVHAPGLERRHGEELTRLKLEQEKLAAEAAAKEKALLDAQEAERKRLAQAAAVPDAGAVAVAPRPAAPPRAPLTSGYEGLLQRADRQREHGSPVEAIELYTKAAALKPERAEPWVGRGLSHLEMSQAARALEAFERALQLNSRYGPAIMGAAEACRSLGRKEEALVFYQRYLEVLPNTAEANVARKAVAALK